MFFIAHYPCNSVYLGSLSLYIYGCGGSPELHFVLLEVERANNVPCEMRDERSCYSTLRVSFDLCWLV